MPRTTTTKPSGKSKSKSRAKPRTFVVDTSVLLSDPLALTRFAEHAAAPGHVRRGLRTAA